MSEHDESQPSTRKRRRARRRSLRVPVDEVPRPTVSADAAEDGGATAEMPAFEEDRTTLEDVPSTSSERALSGEHSIETELVEESIEALPLEEESDPAEEASEGAADASGHRSPEPREELEPLLGAPRDASDEPLAGEATVVQAPPSETAPGAIAGAADALVDEPPSLEVELTTEEPDPAAEGAEDAEPAVEAPSEPAPEGATSEPEPPKPPVPVVVQRVVAIVSGPPAAPPAEDEAGAAAGTELAVELEEPEERESFEELDVDLDEADERRPDSAPELAVAEAEELLEEEPIADDEPARDSTPELLPEEAEELLDVEAAAEAVEVVEGQAKRPSKRPPPPPKAGKEAAPPPQPEPAKPAPVRRKKPRKPWFEELFNDDYLRTVPIPHPRVIQRQCDFIEQRFGLAQGATILDVGCGLGLHAVELTRRGYLVVGLDLSLPMLSRAADEAQDQGFKINFLHADMREMNFDGAFDAVLCYGTTFGYFDDETNKQVVGRFLRALKPRGLLLLDVVNRDYLIRSQPNLVWFEGDGCVVMEESRMNYITSRLEVKRTVILDDGRQRENFYSLRTYSLHELGQILHHQGFRVVEVTGWEAHPGVFFGSDSPKLIILAERRPSGPPSVPGRSAASAGAAAASEPAAPLEPEAIEPDAIEPDAIEAEEAIEPEEAIEDAAEPAAERPEPSPAVTEALLETLEKSGELELAPDEEVAEELGEDDLQDE